MQRQFKYASIHFLLLLTVLPNRTGYVELTGWMTLIIDLERKWEEPLVVHFKIMRPYFSES
jgi:hypothetical protein